MINQHPEAPSTLFDYVEEDSDTSFDEEGIEVKVYTDPLRLEHPNARISPDGTEVVISTNRHGEDCECVSHAEALAYIAANWLEDDVATN